MKSDLKCIHLDLFLYFNHLVSVTAEFYGRLQLIRSVLRASTFSGLKFIEIVIFGVYSPSLLASVCFGTFLISLFNFLATFLAKDH